MAEELTREQLYEEMLASVQGINAWSASDGVLTKSLIGIKLNNLRLTKSNDILQKLLDGFNKLAKSMSLLADKQPDTTLSPSGGQVPVPDLKGAEAEGDKQAKAIDNVVSSPAALSKQNSAKQRYKNVGLAATGFVDGQVQYRTKAGTEDASGKKAGGQFVTYDPSMTQIGGAGDMLLTLQSINTFVGQIFDWLVGKVKQQPADKIKEVHGPEYITHSDFDNFGIAATPFDVSGKKAVDKGQVDPRWKDSSFASYDRSMTEIGGAGDMLLTLQSINTFVGQIFDFLIGKGKKVERDSSLAGAQQKDEGKGEGGDTGLIAGMIASLQDAWGGLSTTQKSLIGVIGLIALMAAWDTITEALVPILAPIVKFMSETLWPALKELNDIILAQPGGYWTAGVAIGAITFIKQFSLMGKLFTGISKMFAPIIKMFPILGKVFGGIGTAMKGVSTGFSFIGKVLGYIMKPIRFIGGLFAKLPGLSSMLKIGASFGKAIPIVGQIIMVIQGLFGFVTGAIEGWKTGGILGAIKGAIAGVWDGIVGSLLNLVADLIGWVLTKLGFEGIGEWFSNLDFSWETLVTKPITAIKEWFGKLFKFDSAGGVIASIVNVITFIPNMIKDLVANVTSWLLGLFGFDNAAKTAANATNWSIGGMLVTVVTDAIGWVKSLFADPLAALTTLGSTIFGTLGSLLGIITWPIDKAINWVMGLFGWSTPDGEPFSLWGAIKSGLSAVWDWIAGLFDFDFGEAIKSIVPSWTPDWLKRQLGIPTSGDADEKAEKIEDAKEDVASTEKQIAKEEEKVVRKENRTQAEIDRLQKELEASELFISSGGKEGKDTVMNAFWTNDVQAEKDALQKKKDRLAELQTEKAGFRADSDIDALQTELSEKQATLNALSYEKKTGTDKYIGLTALSETGGLTEEELDASLPSYYIKNADGTYSIDYAELESYAINQPGNVDSRDVAKILQVTEESQLQSSAPVVISDSSKKSTVSNQTVVTTSTLSVDSQDPVAAQLAVVY